MPQSAFHPFHLEHNATLTDVAGWEMPLHYGSPTEEHQRVREYGGIFDLSHLSRVRLSGRHARRLLEYVLSRYISDMAPRTCRHALVCNEAGGVIDDVIVYRFEDEWMLTGNAVNRAALLAHLQASVGEWTVKMNDQTESTAMVAIQGPAMMGFIGKFSSEVPTLDRMTFTVKNLLVLKMTISRTGFTGEDGIELMLPGGMVGMALKLLFRDTGDGAPPVLPCGLTARDTLRIEAGLPAYGSELCEHVDPLTAGLDTAVSMDKETHDNIDRPFIGQAALERIAANGPRQRRVGLKISGTDAPEPEAPVCFGEEQIGQVSSACISPTLGHPIAMAYINEEQAKPGTAVTAACGASAIEAEVVTLPFYKRA